MSRPSTTRKKPASPRAAKSMAEVLLSTDLLETLPDAIVAVDRNGIIVQVNSQAQELFGYNRGEMIGQKVEMLVPESFRRQHHNHRSAIRTHTQDATHGGEFGSLRETAEWLGIPGRDQP